jgi:carbonic anhydrase
MRITHVFAVAALLAAAAPHPAAAQTDSIDVAAAGGWSYTGPTGPAFWATRLGYQECVGPRQSPVPLPRITTTTPLRVRLDYPDENPGELYNTGHTVDLYLSNPATLTVADTPFVYREVHVHVPAEHTVQGVRHAAELHAVHLSGNAAAVLTTFVTQQREPNPDWNTLIAQLPGNKDDENPIGATDLIELLGLEDFSRERLYSYAGSLTTPRCTPSVRFLIRQRTIALSREQIDALAAAFARNVRPLQTVTTPITQHSVVP